MTQVTGILTDEVGTALANTTCAVVAIDQVVGQDGGGRVSRGSIVVTDGAGEFDADIKPGRYELVVEASAPADANEKFRRIGRMTVHGDTMTLEAALDRNAEPVTPNILQQAIAAKDAAEAAAGLAQSAYQGRQYGPRADFVDDVAAGYSPAIGTVSTADGLAYEYVGGSDDPLGGLPGWLPFGDVTQWHFGAGGADDASAIRGALLFAAENGKRCVIYGKSNVATTVAIDFPCQADFALKVNSSCDAALFQITSSNVVLDGSIIVEGGAEDGTRVFDVLGDSLEDMISGIKTPDILALDCRAGVIFHQFVTDTDTGTITAKRCNKGPGTAGNVRIDRSSRVNVGQVSLFDCDEKGVAFALSDDCTCSKIVSIGLPDGNTTEAFYTNGCNNVFASLVVTKGKNFGVKFSRNSRRCGISSAYLEVDGTGSSNISALRFQGSSDCVASNVIGVGKNGAKGLHFTGHFATGTGSKNNRVTNSFFTAEAGASWVLRLATDEDETTEGNSISDTTFIAHGSDRAVEDLSSVNTRLDNVKAFADSGNALTLFSNSIGAKVVGGEYISASAFACSLSSAQNPMLSGGALFQSGTSSGLRLSTITTATITGVIAEGVNSVSLSGANDAGNRIAYNIFPNGINGASGSVTGIAQNIIA